MANTPLKYRPDAVATRLGWAHEKTGEQLTSQRKLVPAVGTDDYNPNSRNWMNAFNNPPAVPENLTVPVVTGTTGLGDTLTATAGTWNGSPAPTFEYQWTRGGVDIVGATDAAYVIVTDDQGTTVAVTVTATNATGSDTAASSGTAIPAA